MRRKKITLSEQIELTLRSLNIEYVKEHRFCGDRRWRFDYAIFHPKVGIEAEGGVYAKSRHVRGSGYTGDCSKYNRASLDGWIVLRYTVSNIHQLEDDLRRL